MKCKYCGTEMCKGIEVCPKCGRIHKNPFGDKKKTGIIAGIALAVILFVTGIVIGVSGNNSEMDVKIINESKGEYMLINAPADLSLDVSLNSENKETNIIVKDIYGEQISSPVEVSEKTAVVTAPEGGYIKGEIYTIDITKIGTFTNSEFEGAKKLTFVVQKKNTINIEYKADVKELSDRKVELEGKKIILKGFYEEGDIIVADADGNGIQEIYKLNNVSNNEDTTEAIYTEPEADEVYEEIDVFYYEDIDFSKAEIDEEAVGEMLEESGIIEIFTEEAYAADDVLYDAEFDGEKTFKVTIKDPEDENRTLTISFGIEDKALIKVNKKTAMLDNTIKVTSGAELTIKGEKDGETEKSIREAIDKYVSDESEDLSESEYKKAIIPVTIPVAGPVGVYVDLGASANFAVSAEFKAGIDAEVTFTQGIVYDIKKFKVKKTYAEIDGGINAELMAKGELDAYAGLYVEAGVDAASLIEIGLRAEGGPYVDAKGCFVIKTDLKDVEADGYYKVELGLRFKAKASVDPIIIDEKAYILGEADKALLQKGNYLKLEDTDLKDEYQKTSGEIYIGAIEARYHNKITDKETTEEITKYKLYVDGNKISVNDGYLTKSINEGSHKFKIEWKYGGQEFTYEKDIEISEFDPWGYFKSNHDVLGSSFYDVESKYGILTYVSNLAAYSSMDNATNIQFEYWFNDYNKPVFVFDNNSKCNGLAGSAEMLFGISEPVSMWELQENINSDIFTLRWTTDIEMTSWQMPVYISSGRYDLSIYSEGLRSTVPAPEYDPFGGYYPEVTLNNVSEVHTYLQSGYDMIYPNTRITIIETIN